MASPCTLLPLALIQPPNFPGYRLSIDCVCAGMGTGQSQEPKLSSTTNGLCLACLTPEASEAQ